MSTLIGVGNTEDNENKTDWVCLKLASSEKLYTKLPFDAFGSDPIPSGYVALTGDVFMLIKSLSPDGRMKIGIMSLREEPGEVLDPPYLLNMAHVEVISRLSPESSLYEGLQERCSSVVRARPSLVVPI